MSITEISPSHNTSISPQPRMGGGSARFVWVGLLLAVAVIGLFFVQIVVARLLVTPWYLPIGGTLAALLVLIALVKRRTWSRLGVAVLCLMLAALEWLFVAGITVLPAYTGPIKPGMPMPAFQAKLADGSPIGQTYFHQHAMTAVIFYQGRWCPFCRTQLAELEGQFQQFEAVQAKVLAVSMEDVATGAQTQEDYPHLVVVSDDQRELSNAFEVINRGFKPGGGDCDIPTILLVDKSGTVRWVHRPARFISRPSAADLVAEIKKLGT